MKIEVEQDQAYEAIRTQLKRHAERVDCALKLFEKGNHKEAYRMFPYHDPVGANLEEYVNAQG